MYITISVKTIYLSVPVAFFVIKVWFRTCSVIYPTTVYFIPAEGSMIGLGPLIARRT
jgi:hypothetical protein